MKTLNFRYTDDIDVTVSGDWHNKDIFFKKNGNAFLRVVYRKHFKEIRFEYSIFSYIIPFLCNYVKMTAKDGGAFLARININGSFYAIRQKKRKQQIAFFEAIDGTFRNYQLGKDVKNVVCYLDGTVSRDERLINDFFTKREAKEFDEEKYLKSLDPEERKEYLDGKKIESVIELIGKKYNINPEKVENLAFYIECLEEGNEIKNKVLNSDNIDDTAVDVLPLLDSAKSFCESVANMGSDYSYTREDIEYTIDRKYVFSRGDFDSLRLNLTEEEMFVNELYFFFLDEYEQIKEYLEKGIERVKKKIDELLPFFKDYVEGRI